ncbi:MAG: TorF family putative porin [Pseudomonadota bacterium]
MTDAKAQVSGSVSLVSDYRFRGVSLSDGQAEPQLSLGYDSPGGWYAGIFGSGVELYEVRDQQVIVYAGYSRKRASGLTWEVGATASAFLKTSGYNYAEVFAGLGLDDLSGRIYVSPSYFGQATPTVYAELNAAHLIAGRSHVLAHLGYLRSFSGAENSAIVPFSRFDTLLGVSAGLADWRLQLAWTRTVKNRARYPFYGERNTSALVLSASYSF